MQNWKLRYLQSYKKYIIAFYKLYFKLPELKGSAEKGRLLYIVDENKKEIWLMYIYSHKQFEKRPSDSILKKLINFI